MQEKPDNRAKAITFTVLLHVVLGILLVLGIEFSDYQPLSGPKVDIVEAELIAAPQKPRVDSAAEQRKREEAEVKRQREENRKREEQEEKARQKTESEQQRAAEQDKARKAELERKAAESAQKKEAAKRLAEQKEAQKKAELAASKKAEEEARRKAAAEEARRIAEAEQQARESALQEALAQEQRERELNPLKDAYSAAISQQIARNWLKPPGISDDLKCEVLVSQLPDGSVTGAKITRSSGNATFDESVIKAIYKAAPLPQAPTPEVFDRELRVSFCSTGNVC